MRVEHLNARPSLDLRRDAGDRPLRRPVHAAGLLLQDLHPSAAAVAALREVPAPRGRPRPPPQAAGGPRWRTDYRRRHADVLVTGGGVAGLSAAIAAAELGADVVLVDEGQAPGGQALAEGGPRAPERSSSVPGGRSRDPLGRQRPGAFDGIAPVWQGDTLHQVRARRHVFATGAIEQPLVFAGNDLPGVMLSAGHGGSSRSTASLRAHGRSSPRPPTAGCDAALALHAAGVEIALVADLRPTPGSRPPRSPHRGSACGRLDGDRGARATGGERCGDRPARRGRGRRGDGSVRSGRRQWRGGPGDLAGAPGGRAERLRRGSRAFRTERRARWRAPGGRARGCRGRGGRRRLG